MTDIYASNITGPWDQQNVVPNVDRNIVASGDTSTFGDGIDFRYEIKNILARHGYPVLIRKATNERCPNYNPRQRDDHTSQCRYCMGTGFRYRDYIVNSYSRPSVLIEATMGESRQHVGMLSHDTKVYYFEAKVKDGKGNWVGLNISNMDFIVELMLTTDGEGPVKVPRFRKIYAIHVVAALRDKKGRIEYWMCKAAERGIST